MPKLVFDKSGEHYYETGVSNCVLFVKGDKGYKPGVVWNGITSITQSPEGAEENAIYADNIKYLSLRSIEEFKGTIEALGSPVEFDECDGCKEFGGKGVTIGQQSRTPFCFAYKVKKGSDANAELGYKIHIVYGATASPSERAAETVNDSPEATTLSWEFSTVPVESKYGTNIAHITIDSTTCDPLKLKEIENYLYGSDGARVEAKPCEAIKTTDTEIDPSKTYYVCKEGAGEKPGHLVDIKGNSYSVVAEPVVEQIGDYYEVIFEGEDAHEEGGIESRLLLPDEIFDIMAKENKKANR